MSAKTYRLGRAAAWSAVVILAVAGTMGAVAGDWSGVVLAAASLAMSAVVLVVGRQTHPDK